MHANWKYWEGGMGSPIFLVQNAVYWQKHQFYHVTAQLSLNTYHLTMASWFSDVFSACVSWSQCSDNKSAFSWGTLRMWANTFSSSIKSKVRPPSLLIFIPPSHSSSLPYPSLHCIPPNHTLSPIPLGVYHVTHTTRHKTLHRPSDSDTHKTW